MPIIASEGDNRAGKSLTIAVLGWLAHCAGQKVYSACPMQQDGRISHFINYPHEDIDPTTIYQADLYDCTLLEDEFEQLADSRMSWDRRIRLSTYFNYQAKKRGVNWLWTAVRHANVDIRIRRNPDFIIENHRVPKDWRLPLQAVKWKVWNRYSEKPKTFWLMKPQRFFALYNHRLVIPPSRPESSNAELFKQLSRA